MMGGSEVELSWSPGGRYLAITHAAKNQFSIISIADCGPFLDDDDDEEAEADADATSNTTITVFNDIRVGRIVQATSARFNSFDPVWGTTTLDITLKTVIPTLGSMLGDPNATAPKGATTLYYLSDRDIQSDVNSPWGTRAPAPHFPAHRSVYALPLINRTATDVDDTVTKVGHGAVYGGGGAAELWVADMLELEEVLEFLLDTSSDGGFGGGDMAEGSSSTRKRRQRRSLLTAAASAVHTQRQGRQGRRRLFDVPPSELPGDDPDAEEEEGGSFFDEIKQDLEEEELEDGDTATPTTAPTTYANEYGTLPPTTAEGEIIGSNEPSSAGSSDEQSGSMVPTAFGDTGQPSTVDGLNGSNQPSSLSSSLDDLVGSGQPSFADGLGGSLSGQPSSLTSGEASEEEGSPTPSAASSSAATTSMPSSSPTAAPTSAATQTVDTKSASTATATAKVSIFPEDTKIAFGEKDLMVHSYRVAGIPADSYTGLVTQTMDDSTFLLIKRKDDGTYRPVLVAAEPPPSDAMDVATVDDNELVSYEVSTTGEYIVLIFKPGYIKVVPNTGTGLMGIATDKKLTKSLADANDIALSIYPSLEYEQMFHDAWRMLRDYFYDTNMNGIDWKAMHERYKGLVKRCAKREELDDILAQMASELSALHVFVYGGEYPEALHKDKTLESMYQMAGLGATLDRSPEWKGYVVTAIAETDPDFTVVGGTAVYSPLSDSLLRLSGQKGLEVGDVIVGVNGESVMRVPDIHLLLRGLAGQSVRLDVIRLASSPKEENTGTDPDQRRRRTIDDGEEADAESVSMRTEPIITVPLSPLESSSLQYKSWEYRCKQIADSLAAQKGFSVGYLHLSSMSKKDVNAFVKGFYPNYNKEALIVDVRHNRGGNIDSWLLDILQRRAWMYWQGRVTNTENGGLGWDEQFAFRGHLVVLIDEKTSSDGEGFSRGVSELGLGKLIGTRTWGGGIWLSSDNTLVDGGIATAPEIGTYNDEYGWGLGIEQMGVEPDIVVDNDPRETFEGRDEQLERAIEYLADWLEQEPIVIPTPPIAKKKDMSMPRVVSSQCKA
uniref:Tail specific protease domain-containing protein n=1 Tax=Grammatophora oceanica TaxID=210454 RepID=A0A7S1Y7S6_9STRA